jgi:GNAT superfamily N-acetyltransferase
VSAVATAQAHRVTVRDANVADNDTLVALAAACPMAGDVEMCVERAPDFFALARLEGDRWRVGVAESDGVVSGCVTVSERLAYLHGSVARTAYVGDLKVAPGHRGGPSADALVEHARTTCRALGGGAVPVLTTVLAGNRSMERRAGGPRGLPRLTPFATLKVHAIPFLFRRREVVAGLRVDEAREEDLEEMAALWGRVAPERQWAPVMDAEALRAWMRRAPGLAVHDYLVARRPDGRIAGFIGVWDQRRFKQLRVLGYSPRLAGARVAVNVVARLAGTRTLPPAGSTLATLATVMPCVPSDEPSVLRALLLRAYAMHRRSDHLFLTITLDRRDPLTLALVGLFAQPTIVGAYVTTPSGRYDGPALDNRPMHFESALV